VPLRNGQKGEIFRQEGGLGPGFLLGGLLEVLLRQEVLALLLLGGQLLPFEIFQMEVRVLLVVSLVSQVKLVVGR
jgi:hypothetical protein